MFWRKKKTTEQPNRFIKIVEPYFTGFSYIEKSHPGYQDEKMDKPKKLAFHEDVAVLNHKLDLILDHLNLEYIPETEKKEPAKLVEKKTVLGVDWGLVGDGCSITSTWVPTFKSEAKKKKRGRPKKK